MTPLTSPVASSTSPMFTSPMMKPTRMGPWASIQLRSSSVTTAGVGAAKYFS